MKAIWKFDVDPFLAVNGIVDVAAPKGARPIHINEQNNRIRVWCEVDPDEPVAALPLVVVPTGGEVPEGCSYIGTAHLQSRSVGMIIVMHVYGASR